MTAPRLRYPRLALPFTVIPAADQIHLVAGEDVRYTLRIRPAAALADLLRRCDGRRSLDSLLEEQSPELRDAARSLLERLLAERVLVEGPLEMAARPGRYRLLVEGTGQLASLMQSHADRTNQFLVAAAPAGDGTGIAAGPPPLEILCQNSLNFHEALEFNRRCLRERRGPWMWITAGPADRAYVSPVFLPQGGPCLGCLIRGFERLSPAPELYPALTAHGEREGDFQEILFPETATRLVEGVACWKCAALAEGPLPSALFCLHVIERRTHEVGLHRVLLDPACPECSHARLG